MKAPGALVALAAVAAGWALWELYRRQADNAGPAVGFLGVPLTVAAPPASAAPWELGGDGWAELGESLSKSLNLPPAWASP